MWSTNLARLCMEYDDPVLNEEVHCNHGYVMPMLTAWIPRNLGRRYWVCPYYEGPISCDFWHWRDVEIDPRSKFVIPKLMEKIGELQSASEVYETVENPRKKISGKKIEMQLEKLEEEIEKMKEREKKWSNRLVRSKIKKKYFNFLCCVDVL